MTEASLDVQDVDGTLRVALHGEIDIANVATVDGELRALITNRHNDVVIDLADLEHLDSSGLRMLFTLATRLEALQIELHLLVPEDAPPRRVIELSGIGAIASVRPGTGSSPGDQS